jgi:hypothetical protein
MAAMTAGLPAETANAIHGASDETFEIVKSVIGPF